MKLSEAIRLGSMLKPQKSNGDDDGKGSCALLAAAEALGISAVRFRGTNRFVVDYVSLRDRYSFLSNEARCPECEHSDDACCIIWHLNDVHRWTREAIADWVESIENAQVEKEAEHVAVD